LSSFHYGFLVRPPFRNVAKGPKWFLRDWSGIDDPGKRAETFCACHLLKAVEGWSDLGLGKFELRYIRDLQKRGVDFVVLRDGEPWFLVEAKHSLRSLSPRPANFQKQTGAEHALQVSLEAENVEFDCFSRNNPTIVPARTFFSQLF